MKEDLCYYEGCNETAVVKGLCLKHYNLWLGNVGKSLHRNLSWKERFWSFVWRPTKGGCWIWKGSTACGGYGCFTLPGCISARAHRVSWELCYGDIPDDMNVLHKCDNPPCVNPEHLWLGTPSDNRMDSVRKGRAYKLIEDEVLEIRRLIKLSLYTQGDIAKKFKINRSSVSLIESYKTWNYPEILRREADV